jgi:uncharacterized repeat protein (TIGR02543 family)
MKKTRFFVLVPAALLALAFGGCWNPAGDGNGTTPEDITYMVAANGNASASAPTTTTALTFSCSAAISDLTANNITISGAGVTKGALTGSGTSWTLGVGVTTAGNITVSIVKTGIERGEKQVTVYKVGQPAPPGTYTISFESHGGSAVTANTGTAVAKPADPAWDGYVFTGWYSAVSGGTEYIWPHNLTGNVTMHAQWEPARPTHTAHAIYHHL